MLDVHDRLKQQADWKKKTSLRQEEWEEIRGFKNSQEQKRNPCM